MNIKLVAVDMDGTFLNDNKEYAHQRFSVQYQALKNHGIELVIASGNQYYQLISFFPQIHQEISFVAENGALVYSHGEQLYHGELTTEQYHAVLDVLKEFTHINFVMCGLQSAWYQHGAPALFISLMQKHYHRLSAVDNLRLVDDIIFKFSLNLPDEQIPALVARLQHKLDGIVTPVTSGYGFVDLIIPGCHKASGLQRLMDRWGIDKSTCVAIGDGGNDVEMLHLVAYSFAMDNASEMVKNVARYRTASNNHQGVLQVLAAILQGEYPFNQER